MCKTIWYTTVIDFHRGAIPIFAKDSKDLPDPRFAKGVDSRVSVGISIGISLEAWRVAGASWGYPPWRVMILTGWWFQPRKRSVGMIILWKNKTCSNQIMIYHEKSHLYMGFIMEKPFKSYDLSWEIPSTTWMIFRGILHFRKAHLHISSGDLTSQSGSSPS